MRVDAPSAEMKYNDTGKVAAIIKKINHYIIMEESKKGSSMDCEKKCEGKMCGDKVCGGGNNACSCGCGCGWAKGHRVFRVVLGIVILLLMFWIGVKVGEVKMILGESGGHGYRHANPMMQENQQFYGPTTNPPSAAVPTGRALGATSSSPTGL